jgi:xanthine/uracil permease
MESVPDYIARRHNMTDDTPDEFDEIEESITPEGSTVDPEVGEKTSFVEYGIEDKPPLGESIALGVQHYLTMVGSTIAIPLVLASALGMPTDVTARLIGTFFVVSGIATIVQTTVGNRYPIVQGGTFAMLAPGLAIIAVITSQPGTTTWNEMILELQGAVIVAGAIEVLIGYSGVMDWVKRHMGPIVIAPVIALIGLALFNVPQITSASQNWWLVGLTAVLIILFSQYLNDSHRVFKLFPVLLGLGTAWIIAAILSVTGVYAPGGAGYIDFGQVLSASLIQPIYPFQWGIPQFTTSFIIGMSAGMVASVIESFGDYHSVARMAGEGAPSGKRINHGIAMEGIGNVFAGIMGTGNGSTSYTENVGAIAITSVASRYVVQIGAIVMLIVGFIGYFGQLVAAIPTPIVGGLFLVMFGQIAAVGISQLEFVDLDQNRNVFIVGFALFAGLAIPAYMRSVGSATAFQKGMANVAVLGPILGTELVSQAVYIIGGTGMAVGGIIAFFLDNTVPGTHEGRGLDAWEEMTEDSSEFRTFFDYLNDRGTKDQPSDAD